VAPAGASRSTTNFRSCSRAVLAPDQVRGARRLMADDDGSHQPLRDNASRTEVLCGSLIDASWDLDN